MCTELIAKWTSEQDPVFEDPACVVWGDGRPAYQEDYLIHRSDTRELVDTPDGMEMHMFPSVVADIRFDAFYGTWFVTAKGQESISLDLFNVDATDAEIRSALHDLAVIYRAVIHR